MEKKIRTIYAHIFPDKSVYIGSTSQDKLYRRFHYGAGYANQPVVYDRIMFFGWQNTEHIILEQGMMTKDELLEKECNYTLKYAECGYEVLNKYNVNPCRYRGGEEYEYVDEDGNVYRTVQEVALALGRTKQAVSAAIKRNGKCAGKKIIRREKV